jgi:[1-hydroxy-2-(trimethylamino)ethyl]phosphonate dioxygenase
MLATSLDIVKIFAAHGADHYGEAVTQLAHALQCAALGHREGADDEVVLAALLHDIGHLADSGHGKKTADEPESHEDVQSHHGVWGARLVSPLVPTRVAWLIEHHVIAKRYLCTVDRHYLECLSPVSLGSLLLQGGTLSAAEVSRLEAHPWFADAVRIRRWDDLAKDSGATYPPLEAYRPMLEVYFGPQSREYF